MSAGQYHPWCWLCDRPHEPCELPAFLDACPLCGYLQPDPDPVDCDICHHTGCPGCIGTEDGICMTCRDIEKERHA